MTKLTLMTLCIFMLFTKIEPHKICISACGGGLRSAIFTQEFKNHFNKGNEIILEGGISGGAWGLCANKEIETGLTWGKFWGMIKVADMMFETQWREIVSDFLTERNGFYLNHCSARIYYAMRNSKEPNKCDPDTPSGVCYFDAKSREQICSYATDFKPDIITALSVSSSALSTNQAKCLSSGFIHHRRMKFGDFDFYDLGSYDNCPMTHLLDDCETIINLHGSDEFDPYNAFFYENRGRLRFVKDLLHDDYNWVAEFQVTNKHNKDVKILSIQTWEANKKGVSISTKNQSATRNEIIQYKKFLREWINKNKYIISLS